MKFVLLRGEMPTRIQHIDLAAGIMILWMIIYHVLHAVWSMELSSLWDCGLSSLLVSTHAVLNSNGHIEILNSCILFPWLSFFMPWFFYKSGMFFRRTDWHTLWQKDSRKLLRTYVIWASIGYVIYVVMRFIEGTASLRSLTYSTIRSAFLTGIIPINDPLWFLLTLFGVHVVANAFLPQRPSDSATNRDQWLFHLCCALIVLMGYGISYAAFQHPHRLLPLWVANGAAGLSFYTLGYWLGHIEHKWWIVLPCTIVYVLCGIFGFSMVNMLYNKLLQGIYLLWIPTAWCGIVVVNAVCKLVHTYNYSPISYIGHFAMPIYVSHYLVIKVYCFIMANCQLSIRSSWHIYFVRTNVYAIFLCFYAKILFL